MNLSGVSGEYTRNQYSIKNFSDENFTDVSGKEFMFEQRRDKLYRSLSDGEVISSRTGQESGETWCSILTNAKELDGKRPRDNIDPSVEREIRTSSSAELSDGESSSIILLERDFLSNRRMSKSKPSSESVERAETNPNENDQRPFADSEEMGKIKDKTVLSVLDNDYQKDVNLKENQQVTQNSSISLEENGGNVDKRAIFYIGSRPNSGKLDECSNSRAHIQVNKTGERGKEKQGNGVEEEKAGSQQKQCDFYDDIEVISDEPLNRNEAINVSPKRFTVGETSQTKSDTEQSVQSVGFGNTCLINGCDESSLLLPIVSEQPTLPQSVRMEKPVAIRAQPFTDVCPFECFSGLLEHKNDIKIDFNERIGLGGTRYNCGEKCSHRDNTEINLISLSSSSESTCSDCDSKTKEPSKEINKLELSITVSKKEPFMVCQSPNQPAKKRLIDETDSSLYTVKSQSDLSIIVSKETGSFSSQVVKNEDSYESTTPPLLITVETNPQTIDVDEDEMKNDFHTTIPNPERSSHTPTAGSPTQHYENQAIEHAVTTNLHDNKAHLIKSTQVLKETSSSNDDEIVTDAANSRDTELGTYFGENVREKLSNEMFSISDGVDPDLIHFFTNEAISPSPPMSAISESTNTDVDNEVADIMNTVSDDYVIEFKSESSNDWTISSAESEVREIKVPVSFDLKDDKGLIVESRQDPSTSPEPFQAYPPKEFLIDIYQDSENIYNNGFNLEGRTDLIQTKEGIIGVHNEDNNSLPSIDRKEPYGTDEQSYEDEDKMLVSISPFKTSLVDNKNTTPENLYQGGDVVNSEPFVQVFIDKSIDRNQCNEIDLQENAPTNFNDPTKNGKLMNSRRSSLEDISNLDFQPLERTTDSETLLEKLPSVPNEPPCSEVCKEDFSSVGRKEGFGQNVDSSSAVYDDVVNLTTTDDDGVGSVTYPELDIFAKARLRQGGLHNWEMNCLLTELSREQEENERLARDSKRAMEEFIQVKKEVKNILSKFGSQMCVEMF